jgi:hypothetical protein
MFGLFLIEKIKVQTCICPICYTFFFNVGEVLYSNNKHRERERERKSAALDLPSKTISLQLNGSVSSISSGIGGRSTVSDIANNSKVTRIGHIRVVSTPSNSI